MRLVGRFLRRSPVGVDYRPLYIEHRMFAQFGVLGQDIVEASERYHNATNQWMFGLGVFRNIAIDRVHLVRLINFDTGTVMDRTRNGGRNFIYRISTQLNLGEGVEIDVRIPALSSGPMEKKVPLYTNAQLGSVLASDFDRWYQKREGV